MDIFNDYNFLEFPEWFKADNERELYQVEIKYETGFTFRDVPIKRFKLGWVNPERVTDLVMPCLQ